MKRHALGSVRRGSDGGGGVLALDGVDAAEQAATQVTNST